VSIVSCLASPSLTGRAVAVDATLVSDLRQTLEVARDLIKSSALRNSLSAWPTLIPGCEEREPEPRGRVLGRGLRSKQVIVLRPLRLLRRSFVAAAQVQVDVPASAPPSVSIASYLRAAARNSRVIGRSMASSCSRSRGKAQMRLHARQQHFRSSLSGTSARPMILQARVREPKCGASWTACSALWLAASMRRMNILSALAIELNRVRRRARMPPRPRGFERTCSGRTTRRARSPSNVSISCE